MSRKKKILLGGGALLALLLIINHRWVGYLAHVTKHQYRVIFYKERISERLSRIDIGDAERRALNMTLSIRQFSELSYGLKNSTSYQSYFALHREALGYNITVAPELSLKPKSFDFFPIGSFDYLGFFDKAFAEQWANAYRGQGFDVYLAEIGGYSTLGWFEDPLYSSQLNWGEYGLARLLGHEIAHEKLYFKDDTTFSELLASFIERKLALDYLVAQGRRIPSVSEMHEQRKRSEAFAGLITAVKKELEDLYASPFSDADKRLKKAEILKGLKKNLADRKDTYAAIPAAIELLRLPEINNATLVQFHRYTPQGKAFGNLFENCKKQSSENAYNCWFNALEKLKPCSRAARKAWLAGEGKIDAATCRI